MPTSLGKGDHGRRSAWRLAAGIGFLLTGLAEWFVDQPRKGCGGCGVHTTGLVRLARHLGHHTRIVGPPNMEEKAEQHQSDQEKLVK
jgi:hypothetical protein